MIVLDNFENLNDVIIQSLVNKQKMMEKTEACVKMIKENFNIDDTIDQYEDLFNICLNA